MTSKYATTSNMCCDENMHYDVTCASWRVSEGLSSVAETVTLLMLITLCVARDVSMICLPTSKCFVQAILAEMLADTLPWCYYTTAPEADMHGSVVLRSTVVK